MPRAGESKLSLSVRQEGSGAMRMLLRAAYSLTHEPENFPCVVHLVERAHYLSTGGTIQLSLLEPSCTPILILLLHPLSHPST